MKSLIALCPLVIVGAFGFTGCATSKPTTNAPREIPFKPWVSTRKFYYVAEAADEAARHGYDFRAIVAQAAKKDPEGLRKLLDMKGCNFDGAAGELYVSVLAEMMLLWGDYDFSHAISTMPGRVKTSLKGTFTKADLRDSFPLTADVLFGYMPPGMPKH